MLARLAAFDGYRYNCFCSHNGKKPATSATFAIDKNSIINNDDEGLNMDDDDDQNSFSKDDDDDQNG